MTRLALPRGLSSAAARWRLPRHNPAPGAAAIVVKELRGRMRARRAFAILTTYLVLLAGFAWMLERMNETASLLGSGFVGSCPPNASCVGPAIAPGFAFDGATVAFSAAAIGRGIFVGLMMLLTLIVAVLAPAATAGAISGERERQTLELLAVTPISSPAIVLGKLASALAWVFVLILASIPVTALVFVFGGVAPDDIARSYALLVATAIGMGSIGLFFSALLRRTGASTALTFVVLLTLTVGSVFGWQFLYGTGPRQFATGLPKPPPEALLYLNPFIGQADIACGTEGGYGTWCGVVTAIADGSSDLVSPLLQPAGFGGRLDGVVGLMPVKSFPVPGSGLAIGPDTWAGPGAVMPASLIGVQDQLWRRSAASFLGLAIVLTMLSIQLVSPSRRWRPARPNLPGRITRLAGRRPADA